MRGTILHRWYRYSVLCTYVHNTVYRVGKRQLTLGRKHFTYYFRSVQKGIVDETGCYVKAVACFGVFSARVVV